MSDTIARRLQRLLDSSYGGYLERGERWLPPDRALALEDIIREVARDELRRLRDLEANVTKAEGA